MSFQSCRQLKRPAPLPHKPPATCTRSFVQRACVQSDATAPASARWCRKSGRRTSRARAGSPPPSRGQALPRRQLMFQHPGHVLADLAQRAAAAARPRHRMRDALARQMRPATAAALAACRDAGFLGKRRPWLPLEIDDWCIPNGGTVYQAKSILREPQGSLRWSLDPATPFEPDDGDQSA
jgi:hypothetical protein